MIYSIDYFAMTIPTRSPIGEFGHETLLSTVQSFVSFFSLSPQIYQSQASWIVEVGHGFYSTRLRHAVSDVTLSVGRNNAHIYVEWSGKACNNFDAKGDLDNVIKLSASRASRIDFAVDILTNTAPKEFSEARKNHSFKSCTSVTSPSGRTEYVGGRSSERMARVYRYEPPHPRAQYLRVEAEYKGDAAKVACLHYVSSGLQQACLAAHQAFGWEHGDWTPENKSLGKIQYKAYSPENAATVRWLYGDVITALSKAVSSELVDFGNWLEEFQKKLP